MHASKADLEPTVFGDYEGRTVDWDSMRFAFESLPAHFPPDQTPFLGLPDDRCQCPHWGYVIKGRVTYRFADHDEVFEAGDAFYLPAGHIPSVDAGTEYVQFSPTEELNHVSEAMQQNMEAMQRA